MINRSRREHSLRPTDLSFTIAPLAAYSVSNSWYLRMIAGSLRSPAKNNDRSDLRLYLAMSLASGSSFLTARRAVGAVKRQLTLYFSTTVRERERGEERKARVSCGKSSESEVSHGPFQNTPASGRMGLPSNTTDAQPTSNGE